MAITRDQKSSVLGGSSTGAAVSLTWPVNPQAGSSVVFNVNLNQAAAPTGITDNGTTPGTFTLDSSNVASSHGTWIYRCDGITLPSAGSYAISFTAPNGIFYGAAGQSYLGGPLGTPYMTNGQTAASGTSINSGAVNILAGGMAISGFRNSAGNETITLTAPNWVNVGTDPNGSTDEAFGCADSIFQAGTVACTWTVSVSALWNAAVASYIPPAALHGISAGPPQLVVTRTVFAGAAGAAHSI